MLKNPMYRLYAAVGAVLVFGVLEWQFNIIPIGAKGTSTVPLGVELPNQAPVTTSKANVTQVPLPGTSPSTKVTGPAIRINIWEWNAQMGLLYAVGGRQTTQGSLMEKNNVRVSLIRQDDTDKSKEEQIKFAQKLANGDPNPADGVHFVVIMGDQAAGYIGTFNKATQKLGPDYRAEVVASVGWSGNDVSGEDCAMGPEDWKSDPTKAKGSLFAGAIREGDWNILQVWAQQNGIKNNPDETSWDPEAINWVNVDYLKAVELYNSGYCEDRKVVRNGKYTNEPKQHVCVQGVVTWTPGDVNVVHGRGGLVKLLSTKENAFQMPAVLIGVHKWDNDHAKVMQGLLQAAFDGADQVRQYPQALDRAGKAAYTVYADQSAAYWVKYFKGVTERDKKTGTPVPLGGSRVSGLADNLALFGMADGTGDASSSVFRADYEGFGNIVKQQYPKFLPSFPSVSEATNLTFLQALAQANPTKTTPDLPTYDDTKSDITDVVAQKDWNIQFQTGKADLTADGRQTLDQVYNFLVINKLYAEFGGHTDNTGSSELNQTLSEQRAEAAANYVVAKSPALLRGKINTKGYGDSKPIAPNTTAEGKAQNRRVTITVGNKS